jgi:hypothetical protein
MRLFLLAISVFIYSGCSKEQVKLNECMVEATIKDLTGLDGCSFVFELRDGTRLEPLRLLYCGTPPLPKELTDDPLFNFQFVDGKKVKIQFEQTEAASICMVGPVVKITCITQLDKTQD